MSVARQLRKFCTPCVKRGPSKYAAFGGEERHKLLKSEVRYRSFKGGKKGKKGIGVRGKGGAYAEIIRNGNLDVQLCTNGLDVRVRAWTR